MKMKAALFAITFFYFGIGNNSLAQNDTINYLEVDSSGLTLRVSVRRGCVISTFNELEFKFYPDSTCLKFYPEKPNYTEEKVFRQVTVPINLLSRIYAFRDSLAGDEERRINNLIDNSEYSIEFEQPTKHEFLKLYFEYKLTSEERMILSEWFDEFNTK